MKLILCGALAALIQAQTLTPGPGEIRVLVNSPGECTGKLDGQTYTSVPPQYGCIVPIGNAGGQPPAPGQIPAQGGLLVGPAADRYKELLQKEKKLGLSNGQLFIVLAELDIEIYKQQEGSTWARIKQLQEALAAKVKTYQALVAEAIADAGKPADAGCSVNLSQEVTCPEKKP